MAPRVFTIPASAPFLPTLIEALTDGKLDLPPLRDPLALASATLYLPTRRTCRRCAGVAASASWARTPAFADAAHHQLGQLARNARPKRRTACRADTGGRLRAGRRA